MKGRKLAISDLHDATVRSIWLDWATGEAHLELSVAVDGQRRHARLKASEVTRLDCPRQAPWGPSVSILEVQRGSTPTGVRLAVNMQSGDVIVIESATVALEVVLEALP